MELLDPGDPTAQHAAREAEDRQWPDAETWENGADALRFPGLYDLVEPAEDDEDDVESPRPGQLPSRLDQLNHRPEDNHQPRCQRG